VHVAGSKVRCPFCHDDVQTGDPTWVACADCLARHHAGCWDEGRRCSSCGATDRLARAPGTADVSLTALPEEDECTTQRNVIMGGPPRLVRSRQFLGKATIDDAAWLQATVRRAAKVKGRVSLEGRSLIWRPVGKDDGCKGTSLTVSLTPKENRTELRLEEDLRPAFAGMLAGALAASFVLGSAGVGALASVGLSSLSTLLVPLLFVALLLLWRLGFGRHGRRRDAIQTALLQRLTDGLSWSPPRQVEPKTPPLEKHPAVDSFGEPLRTPFAAEEPQPSKVPDKQST
jgi:hypothetical protein